MKSAEIALKAQRTNFFPIWVPHGGEYEDGCFLGCTAVQTSINLPFQRSLSPPSSGRWESNVFWQQNARKTDFTLAGSALAFNDRIGSPVLPSSGRYRRPNDGSTGYLWYVGNLLPDYRLQQLIRQLTSPFVHVTKVCNFCLKHFFDIFSLCSCYKIYTTIN
jgi:hypothetical protein